MTLVADHEVTVSDMDNRGKTFARKKPVRILDRPMLVESPGRVSLLVLPIDTPSAAIKIHLKPLEAQTANFDENKINESLNNLVAGINAVYAAMSQEKNKDAKAAIERLVKSYPKVTFLNFIKASCHMLNSEPDDAVEALKAGLQDFPNYKQALELYKQITGNDYSGGDEGR